MVWKNIIIEQSQWFNINETQAYKCFNYCFENQDTIKKMGKDLMKINRNKFTLNKMTEKLDEIMETYIKDIPQQVALELPKLKKINKNDKSKLQNVKLPKLKKVSGEEIAV
jgi:hypothetical protein